MGWGLSLVFHTTLFGTPHPTPAFATRIPVVGAGLFAMWASARRMS